MINSLYEIRKNFDEENAFIQRKLITYLKKSTPDELLINSTIKYPQFKDDSKKLKLFLLDAIDGDDEDSNGAIGSVGRYIA